jgi:hypothetical protein
MHEAQQKLQREVAHLFGFGRGRWYHSEKA